MTLERILLQTIKFDLQVEHPYALLLKSAKGVKGLYNCEWACLKLLSITSFYIDFDNFLFLNHRLKIFDDIWRYLMTLMIIQG